MRTLVTAAPGMEDEIYGEGVTTVAETGLSFDGEARAVADTLPSQVGRCAINTVSFR